MSWKVCPNCGSSVKHDDFFCQSCGTEIKKKTEMEFTKTRSRVGEYRGHVQILGTVEIVLGIIALFLAIFVAIFSLALPLLIRTDIFTDEYGSPSIPNEEGFAIFLGILLFVVALAIFIFAIASIVSGRRLMNFKESGRTGSMVIGALYLLMFPLGTIFGVATLYVLTRPEVEPLFR